ncbi:ATP-binding protein [Streptomyces sp. NPDC055607]
MIAVYDSTKSAVRNAFCTPVVYDDWRRDTALADRRVNPTTHARDPRPAVSEPARTAAWTVEHSARAVGRTRHEVRARLREWGVGEDAVDGAVLVVSELVTNAVEHAFPPVLLTVRHAPGGSCLRVSVHDGGPSSTPGTRSRDHAPEERGRGTSIVEFIASDRGECHDDDGLCLRWADIDV